MTSTIKPRKILSETVLFVFKNRNLLLKALCIPFVLYATLDFIDLSNRPMWAMVILYIIALVMETWFAVTTHRLVLLGSDSVPTWGLRKITRREVFFFFHALIFFAGLATLLYIMPRTLAQVLPYLMLLNPEFFLENYYVYMIPVAIIGVFFICVGLIATIRFTLVFPAIAIGQGVTFPLSWKLSKRHQIPLFITLIGFPLILGTPEILLNTVPGSTVVVSMLGLLMNVFVVAALSISYREICKIEYDS